MNNQPYVGKGYKKRHLNKMPSNRFEIGRCVTIEIITYSKLFYQSPPLLGIHLGSKPFLISTKHTYCQKDLRVPYFVTAVIFKIKKKCIHLLRRNV